MMKTENFWYRPEQKPHVRKLETGSWGWYQQRSHACPRIVAKDIPSLTSALERFGWAVLPPRFRQYPEIMD